MESIEIHKPVQLDTDVDMTPCWSALHGSAKSSAREQIIDVYLPFARILAAKLFANRPYAELEFADYMQYAAIGLMESIDRFDPARGVKFETFAAPRIHGAILSGIESLSEKQAQINARQRALSARVQSLKDVPPEPEDASAVFNYLAELAIKLATGFALDDPEVCQAEEAYYPDNTYRRVEFRQLRQRVREMVEQLPPKEKRIVKYHYLQQLPFEEVSMLLDLSKGRVSQIHKEALKKLERIMRKTGGIDLRC